MPGSQQIDVESQFICKPAECLKGLLCGTLVPRRFFLLVDGQFSWKPVRKSCCLWKGLYAKSLQSGNS